MKIIKYHNHKKSILAIVVAMILLAGTVTAFYFYQTKESGQSNEIDMGPPSEQESQAGRDIKQSTIDQSTDKSQTGSDPSPAPVPVEGSDKSSVGAKITATNYNDGILNVRTLLQTVTSSGTCELSMSGPNGATYSASADVQALPSSSTCKGFDVPIEKLVSGAWKIAVTFNNDHLTAVANEEVIIP